MERKWRSKGTRGGKVRGLDKMTNASSMWMLKWPIIRAEIELTRVTVTGDLRAGSKHQQWREEVE